MTSINTYDPARFPEWWADPPLPIVALVVGTLNLLEEAADLPQPVYVTVSSTQSLDFQFADDKASFGALAQWLDVFGGTIAANDIRREDGTPARLCRVTFTYHGVPAEAYAVVTAEPATT